MLHQPLLPLAHSCAVLETRGDAFSRSGDSRRRNAEEVHFRTGDYYKELQEDFNKLCREYNESIRRLETTNSQAQEAPLSGAPVPEVQLPEAPVHA